MVETRAFKVYREHEDEEAVPKAMFASDESVCNGGLGARAFYLNRPSSGGSLDGVIGVPGRFSPDSREWKTYKVRVKTPAAHGLIFPGGWMDGWMDWRGVRGGCGVAVHVIAVKKCSGMLLLAWHLGGRGASEPPEYLPCHQN